MRAQHVFEPGDANCGAKWLKRRPYQFLYLGHRRYAVYHAYHSRYLGEIVATSDIACHGGFFAGDATLHRTMSAAARALDKEAAE
jgi:hypothetical protein